MTEQKIREALREVHHPAMQDRDIVDLGMVSSIEIEDGCVTVTLAFSKKRDPLSEYLIGATRAALIRSVEPGV